jgi:hypothetical protein
MAQSLPTPTPVLSALERRTLLTYLKSEGPYPGHMEGHENLCKSSEEFKDELIRQAIERFQAKLREWEQSDRVNHEVGPDGLTRRQLIMHVIRISISQLG